MDSPGALDALWNDEKNPMASRQSRWTKQRPHNTARRDVLAPMQRNPRKSSHVRHPTWGWVFFGYAAMAQDDGGGLACLFYDLGCVKWQHP